MCIRSDKCTCIDNDDQRFGGEGGGKGGGGGKIGGGGR
jgi:hypothetical protein